MKLVKKDIAVELRTVIDDRGEKELSIIKQIGNYVKKENIEVISFIEKTNEFGDVENLITIRPNKINIKRSGKVSMNQQFIKGKETECLYRHPYGSFLLEIMTKSITHQSLADDREGKVIIQYDVKVNKEESRYHHLTLTYMEAKLR
ncbi:DUF1934 domain-containing protein [Pseudogracilibacillus sp. SO30301A]|uniref:DUF1934 domain-containing protein n=1 Tax=Pseudogracilibacillus sp. SO30301A TaxID=3098291 RepID=UPI00300E0F61